MQSNENEAVENYEVSIMVRKHDTADGRTFYGATARVCDFSSPDYAGHLPMFDDILDKAEDVADNGETYENAEKSRFRFKLTMKSGATLPTAEGIYKATFKGSCWIDKRPSTTRPTIWANAVPATCKFEKTKDVPPLPTLPKVEK